MSATVIPLRRVNHPFTCTENQLADDAARRTIFAARELIATLNASKRTNEIRHPEQDQILDLLASLSEKVQ